MDRKKLMELVAALFIAVIFISSYISLTSYNATQATTSVPGTAYAQAISTARLTHYSSPMVVDISCQNSTAKNHTSDIVNATLSALESNSLVLNFYSVGTNISIAPENMDSYSIYSLLQNRTGSSGAACMKGYATAYISLPQQLNITITGGQQLAIPVPGSYANESVYLEMNRTIGSVLYVKESMLVTQNGSIYGPMSIVLLSYDPFHTSTTSIKPTTALTTTVNATTTANAITTASPATTANTASTSTQTTTVNVSNLVTTANNSGSGVATGGA